MPYGLISLNAVTKNKNTQNAVFLKELWKKRRGATRSEGKPDNPKTRKIVNTEKFKTAEGSEQQAKVFTVAAALNLPLDNCKK